MIDKHNILDLETRQQIYQFILRNPGSYEREIFKKMKLSRGTLRYHLKFLEKKELIIKSNKNKYNRYYVAKKFGKKEKEILNLLKEEIPRKIVLYLLWGLVFSQIELSRELEKEPALIAFHLNKLKDLGIIKYAYVRDGKVESFYGEKFIKRNVKSNEKIYMIKDDKLYYILYDLLIICKDSSTDRKTLNLVLLLPSWKKHYGKRILENYPWKEVFNFNSIIDKIIEEFWEICPHPYHV